MQKCDCPSKNPGQSLHLHFLILKNPGQSFKILLPKKMRSENSQHLWLHSNLSTLNPLSPHPVTNVLHHFVNLSFVCHVPECWQNTNFMFAFYLSSIAPSTHTHIFFSFISFTFWTQLLTWELEKIFLFFKQKKKKNHLNFSNVPGERVISTRS